MVGKGETSLDVSAALPITAQESHSKRAPAHTLQGEGGGGQRHGAIKVPVACCTRRQTAVQCHTCPEGWTSQASQRSTWPGYSRDLHAHTGHGAA